MIPVYMNDRLIGYTTREELDDLEPLRQAFGDWMQEAFEHLEQERERERFLRMVGDEVAARVATSRSWVESSWACRSLDRLFVRPGAGRIGIRG
jgi:hypothetical protein